jgi:hypothetical protein
MSFLLANASSIRFSDLHRSDNLTTKRVAFGVVLGLMLSGGIVLVWSALHDTDKTLVGT